MTDLSSDPKPEVEALGLLIRFAKSHRNEAFSAEAVTKYGIECGVQFQDQRTWGAVFRQAAKEGYIRRSNELFEREFGNKTLAPGWIGT